MKKEHLFELTATALLIAIGILIPMIPYLRVFIPPAASYTIASHVAIFIAMFISPRSATAVTIGATVGFFFAGLPLVIVFRAASHILWSLPASIYIRRAKATSLRGIKLRLLSIVVAVTHAAAEAAAVLLFFMGAGFPDGQGIMWVFGFIGIGTIAHSLLDFEIANIVRRGLQRASFTVK